MNCRLRSYDTSPPGGFPYVQPPPLSRNFPTQPVIEAQARNVMGFRQNNRLPRATYAECLADVDQYQCQRLGCNSGFCIPINDASPDVVSLNANAPGLSGPCKGCGVVVQ